ncbi:MAG: HaeII family restriction endonuclease [Actinomycetota bacterium]|nr:HaeII family restriction endonuclease [Actinomycetota bacterium]
MSTSLEKAKNRLDRIIDKARVDLYKPVQVAEVLRKSREDESLNISDLDSYRNPSVKWRDTVTMKLTGKRSSSSARYQHDLWNDTAMPPTILEVLDRENKDTGGAVERYVYMRYQERQGMVTRAIVSVEKATAQDFQLRGLLEAFVAQPGIRRSVDKAYEIVVHSLFETLVVALEATVKVRVPETSRGLIEEFPDLSRVLLGLSPGSLQFEQPAHIYRVGVTNAADRGLDMWSNFGPAIQVKHLTLSERLAEEVVDKVESDHIVIVCRDIDAKTIETITKQIGWGNRVRGIVRESELIHWYELCLRGRFADRLATPLLDGLRTGFEAEFPQSANIADFLAERGYLDLDPTELWLTESEKM